MAIQSPYEATTYGFSAPSAYTKIVYFVAENIEPKHINIKTETYYDLTARNSGKQPIGVNSYLMNFLDTFTFADMYNFLKAQSEFVGAIDLI